MNTLTPEQVRVRSHADASEYPAIAELRALLSSGAEVERTYWEWLSASWTQRMTRALEEFADNPAANVLTDARDSVLVQYGITTGIQFALKLLSNPRRVFPGVFRDPQKNAEEALDSYAQNADQAIDNM